jgi:hypothetical protein
MLGSPIVGRPSIVLTKQAGPRAQDYGMYEMYPDTWHVADDGHHDTAGRPRRRARKEHPVVPAVPVAPITTDRTRPNA